MTKSITTTARVDIGILLLLAYPVGGSLVSILLRYLLAHFDSLTVGFVRALSGGGPRTFTLPKPVEVIYDLFAGQIVARDTDVYQVVLPAASTSLYFTGAAEKLPQVTRLTEQASSFISRPSS